MKIIKHIQSWQKLRSELGASKTLGVVMTMGALHQGHLSLIQQSQQDNDYTLVTLFINPAQFNDQNDFINYPDTFAEDIKLLKNAGVDFVLTPSKEEIYNDNYNYQIHEKHFSKISSCRVGQFTKTSKKRGKPQSGVLAGSIKNGITNLTIFMFYLSVSVYLFLSSQIIPDRAGVDF